MNTTLRSLGAGLIFVCTGASLSAQTAVHPAPATPAGTAVFERANLVTPSEGESVSDARRWMIANVPDRIEQRANVIWGISVAAVLGASAMDAATSMGKYETNPLLRGSDGKFGSKGIAIKMGFAGATVIPQLLLRNHASFRKAFTIANFAQAGLYTGVAIHNAGVKAPQN